MARSVRTHRRARAVRQWSVAAAVAIVVAIWVSTFERELHGGALGGAAGGRSALESMGEATLQPAPEDTSGEDAGAHGSDSAPLRVTVPVDEPPPEPLPCFVRVASTEGPMLPGAVVRSSFGPSASEPWIDRGSSRAVTDGRGEAIVSRPHAGVCWDLHVDAAGHFHHRTTRVSDDDVLVRLARATELSGITVDAETGSPLAGVEVAHVHDRCEGCDPTRVRSDADGRFVLRSVPLGVDVTLTARVAGYGEALVRLHVLAEDDERTCRIALRRTTAYRLAVVDVLSGAPVVSAEALPSGARAERDGVVALEGMPDSERRVHIAVRAPGYLVSEARVEVTRGARITVPLLEGAHITGSVRRPDGTAVAGATVTAVDDEEALEAQEVDPAARASELPAEFVPRVDERALVATTDGDGKFELRGLWPRWRYVLAVTHPGSVPVELRDIATNHPGRNSMVALVVADVALGSWRGRALSNGEPVDAELEWQSTFARGSARTDRDGAFTLTGLPAGEVSVFARAVRRVRGEPRAEGSASELVPIGGELQRDLVLSADTDPLLVTRGFVLTPLLQGLGGVEVSVDDWRERVVAFTEENGAFALAVPGPPTKRFRIRASSHGREVTSELVRPGSEGTKLVLPRCVATAVQVVEAETGREVERWTMSVRAKGLASLELGRTGDALRDPAESLGGGRVVYLPEGPVQLELSVPGLSLGVRREVTIAAGHVSRLIFRVPACDVVELRLEAEGEIPLRLKARGVIPAGTEVHIVPTERAEEVVQLLRAGRWVPPIEVPVNGRLASVREDGGAAWESPRTHRFTGPCVVRIKLRRDVDYTLIAEDPGLSITPALILSFDRAPDSKSVHTLRAAE